MRHRRSGRKFSRNMSHRKALLKNLMRAMVEHERIVTTQAKGKELRGLVDRLITLSKKGSVHARRQAYSVLGNRSLVKKLFDTIGPRYGDRKGGYTRLIKLSPRLGDKAPMVIVQFVK